MNTNEIKRRFSFVLIGVHSWLNRRFPSGSFAARLAMASRCLLAAMLLAALPAAAATHYVNLTNSTPAAPFTTWLTAATNIQAAVDAAVAGDLILVSNGVYQTAATAVYGMSNRVAVTQPVTVQSVNGPAVTTIASYQVPGTTNGPAAVRCVYLTSDAVLSGFTLTKGATQSSGNSFTNQSGGGVWCESASAVVTNCVLTGSSAYYNGGGACAGTLNNCTLTGNSTSDSGGGTASSTLNNCALTGNSAYYNGGGSYAGTLNNCTLTGNSARLGGGVHSATLNNCLIYYNTVRLSGDNYYYGTLNYCCTMPLPDSGNGNFTAEPQLASATCLSGTSPCRGAGSATYATGRDLDGEPWANPPAVGCDEYWSGAVTGTVTVAIQAAYTNVAVGFAVDFQGLIGGRVSASRWDFGDGVVVSNRPYASHAWNAPGDYAVELRGYNGSNPSGLAASVMVRVVTQPVHYVALNSLTPLPPYSSWAMAATSIQAAVDAALVPGALVLVSNGVYQAGASAVFGMSNRVAVTKPVTVRSVNGPLVTTIAGYQIPGTTNGNTAVRCVYLTSGAVLSGFTLTKGARKAPGIPSRTNQAAGCRAHRPARW